MSREKQLEDFNVLVNDMFKECTTPTDFYNTFITLKNSLENSLFANLENKRTKECPKCKHFIGCEEAVWTGPCKQYDERDTEGEE